MNNKMMVISEMHAYIILLPAHEPAHVHVRWRVHSDYATLSSTWWPRSFDRNGQKVLQTSVIHDSSVARLRSPFRGQTEAPGGKARLLHCDTSHASSIQAGAVLNISCEDIMPYLNICVCVSLSLLHTKYQTTHSY